MLSVRETFSNPTHDPVLQQPSGFPDETLSRSPYGVKDIDRDGTHLWVRRRTGYCGVSGELRCVSSSRVSR